MRLTDVYIMLAVIDPQTIEAAVPLPQHPPANIEAADTTFHALPPSISHQLNGMGFSVL